MAIEKTTIARPYAEAAFSLASNSGKMDKWSGMLGLLSSVISDDRVSALMANPGIAKQTKIDFLFDICGLELNNEGRNFVRLLAENNRLQVLPEIASYYEKLKNDYEGSLDVEITSAYELDEVQQRKLSASLQKKLGKRVILWSQGDAALIGGVRIRAGDMVIDGSIKEKIARLATEFGI